LHKHRAGWFYARVSWPLRDRSTAQLRAERRRVERSLPTAPVPVSSKWQSAGPTNIGGRTTSLACDPLVPQKILAGTAGGGVWKSLDAGRTWKSTMGKHEHNIGALALDPRNPKVVLRNRQAPVGRFLRRHRPVQVHEFRLLLAPCREQHQGGNPDAHRRRCSGPF
jgi:hypothetical protein